MLRRLAAALLFLALAPVALAEDSTCKITYQNDSGTDFKGQASLWKGETLQIGDTTYNDAKGGTFNFGLDNGSTLVIQAADSKECDIVAFITDDADAALKSEVEATGSGGKSKTACYEDNENFNKYGCSCTHNKGAHHAEITMTCGGKQRGHGNPARAS